MGIVDLWLPILLSAVFVFIASSVIHMVIGWHNKDFEKLGNEEPVAEGIRAANSEPGTYSIPGCESMKQLGEPETIARFEKGPVAFVTIMPNGLPKMGKSLAQWFVFSLVIGIFCAYVVRFTEGTDADMAVFRLTGTVAFIAYGLTNVTNSIWKGVSWPVTGVFLLDGLIYGLVTGGTFGWLAV